MIANDADTVIPAGGDSLDTAAITEAGGVSGPRAARHELMRGSSMGRFIVLDFLGAGGMGAVYSAYDPELDRKVALKLVPVDTGTGSQRSPSATRLLREAQSMAQLSHPNVVAIYDVGSVPGSVYLAMENIQGRTLTAWLAEAPRTLRQILPTFIGAGRGLAAAHAVGLVHRDFKPDNVMVGDDGRVRVLDFGLARPTDSQAGPLGEGSSGGSWSPASHLELRLTAPGTVMGTPYYMAPEQHLGRPTDARCDIYAFCVTLWEAVYRKHPFRGGSLPDLARNVIAGAIDEPPRGAGVPRWLRAVLLRGLAPDPNQRFSSMQEVLAPLERDRTRRVRFIAGGAAMAAAILGTTIAMRHVTSEARCDDTDDRRAGVWDDNRKDQIAAAFAEEGKTYAEASWRSVERTLNAYADGVAEMRREACEATRILGTQSDEILGLRIKCLDRRWQRFGMLSELLAQGGTQTLLRAADAAQALPSLEPCADIEGLLAEVPPADDPEVRTRVEEIRAENERIEMSGIAGKYDDLAARVAESVTAARATEYPPVVAETLLMQGVVLHNAGNVEPAAAALEEALQSAQTVGYDRIIATAATTLVTLEAHGRNRFDVAHVYAALADGVIQRMGDKPRLRMKLEADRGKLATLQSQRSVAIEHYQRAAKLADEVGLSGSELLAILNPLSVELIGAGRLEEAGRVLDHARRVVDEDVGPAHPNAALLLTATARLRHLEGKDEDSLALDQQAYEVIVASLGPNHVNAAAVANSIGLTYTHLGRDSEARKFFADVAAVLEKTLGGENLALAASLTNLGLADVRLGQPMGGATHLRRALSIREAKLGKNAAPVAESLHSLGYALAAAGAYAEADQHFRLAIDAFERNGQTASAAYPWLGLGKSLLDQGRTAHAVAALERGLAQATDDEPGPGERGDGRFALARALARESPQSPRIAELTQGAQADYERAGHERDRERDALTSWLAAPR